MTRNGGSRCSRSAFTSRRERTAGRWWGRWAARGRRRGAGRGRGGRGRRGAEGLVLRRGGGVAVDGEVVQEGRVISAAPRVRGWRPPWKADEGADPVEVRLLRARGIVQAADGAEMASRRVMARPGLGVACGHGTGAHGDIDASATPVAPISLKTSAVGGTRVARPSGRGRWHGGCVDRGGRRSGKNGKECWTAAASCATHGDRRRGGGIAAD